MLHLLPYPRQRRSPCPFLSSAAPNPMNQLVAEYFRERIQTKAACRRWRGRGQ
jgi:hypothetical protein